MKTILLFIAAISLILIPAEAETTFLQVLWTGGWTSVLVISAKILEKYYLTDGEEQV